MDLGLPLRTLLPAVAARCLEVLAAAGAEAGLSGREVARRVGASSAAVARAALLALVQMGLVTREATPTRMCYRVNRDHLIWPAIVAALAARDEFGSRVAAYVQASPVPDATVMLYGSTARGEASEGSDVDLLVVFPDEVDLVVRDAFSVGLSDAIRTWTGGRPEIYDLTVADLQQHVRDAEPIVRAWRRDGQLLAGVLPDEIVQAA